MNTICQETQLITVIWGKATQSGRRTEFYAKSLDVQFHDEGGMGDHSQKRVWNRTCEDLLIRKETELVVKNWQGLWISHDSFSSHHHHPQQQQHIASPNFTHSYNRYNIIYFIFFIHTLHDLSTTFIDIKHCKHHQQHTGLTTQGAIFISFLPYI